MPPWSAAFLLFVTRAAQATEVQVQATETLPPLAPPPAPPPPLNTTCIGSGGACVLGGVAQGACCCPNSCFQQNEWYSRCLSECPIMAETGHSETETETEPWDCSSTPHSGHCQYTFLELTSLKSAVVAFDANVSAATATYGPISGWGVSAITSMHELFKDLSAFNADISGWETSGVTNMHEMFRVRSGRAPNSTWTPPHALGLSSPHATPLLAHNHHTPRPDTAGRVGVQPAAEPRHVQSHKDERHVSCALRACPAPDP